MRQVYDVSTGWILAATKPLVPLGSALPPHDTGDVTASDSLDPDRLRGDLKRAIRMPLSIHTNLTPTDFRFLSRRAPQVYDVSTEWVLVATKLLLPLKLALSAREPGDVTASVALVSATF